MWFRYSFTRRIDLSNVRSQVVIVIFGRFGLFYVINGLLLGGKLNLDGTVSIPDRVPASTHIPPCLSEVGRLWRSSHKVIYSKFLGLLFIVAGYISSYVG